MGRRPVTDALRGADSLQCLAFFPPDTQRRKSLRELSKLLSFKTFCTS